jgi:outer membrane protein assembly factor BamB
MMATLCLATWLATAPLATAQFERAIVLPPAEVDGLDSASATHLENANRFLAERQWAEAVEAVRRVQEGDSARLVRVDLARPTDGFELYITAAEYCQWRLAALAEEAPDALAHYRRLVDPLAESWLREGSAKNDESLLKRVVNQAFASASGDEALLKLGDLALARGDQATARAAWQRIAPGLNVPPSAAAALRAPVGSPLWLPLRKFDFVRDGAQLRLLLDSPGKPMPGCYPNTDLELADIRARLVLASLLEGSQERAKIELAILRLMHPPAEGQLAGRRGRYADLLQSLVDESAAWPAPRALPGWITFGGNAARGKIAADDVDLAGQPLWSFELPRLTSDRDAVGTGRLRVADDMKSLLSYHPVVVDQTVLLRLDARGNSYVIALALTTGQKLWQVDYSRGLADGPAAEVGGDEAFAVSDAHADLTRHVGVARYTLTAHGNRIFARMGSPITWPSDRRQARWLAKDQGFLLGLDLQSQGKPLEGFPIRPESSEWSFEGPPLCDGQYCYLAMRRAQGARSQLYLAAYELQTAAGEPVDLRDENVRPRGRLAWRTRLASAAEIGAGDLDQVSQLLVTKDGGRLYLNSGAGFVAAVSADNGRLLWLVKYPRAAFRTGDPDQPEDHAFRDLVPCLAYQDLVIAAPADSDRVFALDAATGQLAWTLQPGEANDIVHLLGARGDKLMASGDRMYWIDVNTGRVLTQFPAGLPAAAGQAAASPRGLGRGTLAGKHVWFPTRESIFVFDQEPSLTDFGWQPKLIREIPLVPRGITGGNLVLANGVLLIATGERLVAFDEIGPSAGERGALAP